MSNFYCEHCGTAILEGKGGYYVTGCEHYPLKQSNPKAKIPPGPYCYTPFGYQNGVYKINPCPYWSKRADKPHQESGYCAYLGYGDWEVDGISLLWDQVKECEVNEED